jgi:hypothetical protein
VSTRDNLSLLPLNALGLTGQGFTVHVLLEIAAVHELCKSLAPGADQLQRFPFHRYLIWEYFLNSPATRATLISYGSKPTCPFSVLSYSCSLGLKH